MSSSLINAFCFSQLVGSLVPGLTVREALDLLLEDEEGPIADTVFIAPPDPAIQSDEDSGDEDAGGTTDNLNARQLQAEAEIRYNDIRDDTINFSSIPTRQCRTWYSGSFESSMPKFPEPSYNKYKDFSLVELFELFISEDIIDMFVTETNRYAIFINAENPRITPTEIKAFIAILVLSGYNSLSNRRLYWDIHDDTRNHLIVNSMRRNRFEQILRFFHCKDNTQIDNSNKMWKIQPLIDKVKSNCLRYFEPEQNLSYDESMVKYYGKHSCKQFIRNKPVRFGYKIWCLCTSIGYLVDFDIYQGKNAAANKQYQNMFGKASTPLVEMIYRFPNKLKILPFHFFFDNLFTGLNLLSYLRQCGYGGTGTLRSNRLNKSCPLPDNKIMEKMVRGSYKSVISREDGVSVVRWKDNSVVTVGSNCIGVEPITNVKRFSQSEKKYIQIQRPSVIGEYNRSMGGVDRLDQNVSEYRVHIRNRKWYWAIMTWLIYVSIQNAWLIGRKAGKKMTQLEFRRRLYKSI